MVATHTEIVLYLAMNQSVPPVIRPVNILLAEDHVMFSETMAESLEKDPNISIVGTVRTGEEALAAVERGDAIDLILMDVRMEGASMDGIEAAKEILKHYRNIKVIMLSAFCEGHLINKAYNAGINGYILKGDSRQSLVTAINMVLAKTGVSCYMGKVKEAMDKYVSQNRGTPDKQIVLTPTQQEILEALAQGMSSKDIAQARNRQPDTITVQRRALLSKFNVKNVAELVKEAIRRGFIEV